MNGKVVLACGAAIGVVVAAGSVIAMNGGGSEPEVDILPADDAALTSDALSQEVPAATVRRSDLIEDSQGERPSSSRGDWENRWEQFRNMTAEEREVAMRKFREEQMQQALAKYDADGDGELSEEERRKMWLDSPGGRRMLARYDTDGDGQLSDEERAVWEEERRRREEERHAQMVDRFDIDGDGELSEAERDAAREIQREERAQRRDDFVRQYDRNADGELDLDERNDARMSYREQRDRERFRSAYDSDGDGSVGVSDFEAFLRVHERGEAEADVNRDGVVDTADIQAFRDGMLNDDG